MVASFTLALIMPGSLITAIPFAFGLLLTVIGILSFKGEVESTIMRLQLEREIPTPEDIKKRPFRRPRR